MADYRNNLPQLSGQLMLTDGGLETTLVFHNNIELPCFAAFTLLDRQGGEKLLLDYFHPYIELASERGLGLILDTCTWRANRDWGEQLGYNAEGLQRINDRAVTLLSELRSQHHAIGIPLVINAVVGPRGDGYLADTEMNEHEAENYHSEQVRTFAETQADMVSAITMTYAEEAIGVVNAARNAELPVAVSFTLETDGRLPSGQSLQDAIQQTDSATQSYASYFMINCAHPTHFAQVLEGGKWLSRIQGVRANASTMSHQQLDNATELDDGDPQDLAERYIGLSRRLPKLNVVGGCCGTDLRHIRAIAEAMSPSALES